MPDGWNDHLQGGHSGLVVLLVVVVALAAGALLFALLNRQKGPEPRAIADRHRPDDAIALLRPRFASGDLDEAAYRRARSVLTEASPPSGGER